MCSFSSPKGGSEPKNDDVLVVGIGNELLRDEGVGVHVARQLQALGLPVRVIEAGVSGLGLIDLMDGIRRVIIVDAVMMGQPPGTVVRFGPSEVKSSLERAALSLHGTSLLEVLALAETIGYRPEVIIIGVQPKEVSWGTELTPEVAAQVPKILEIICREIRTNGAAVAKEDDWQQCA